MQYQRLTLRKLFAHVLLLAFYTIFTFAASTVAEVPLVTIKRAAQAGDANAQVRQGISYQQSNNFTEAETWFKKAAATGHAEAMVTWVISIALTGSTPVARAKSPSGPKPPWHCTRSPHCKDLSEHN